MLYRGVYYMRSRASALMLAPLLALRSGAGGGSRRRHGCRRRTSRRTRRQVDEPERSGARCSEIGYDMTESGYDHGRQRRRRSSSCLPDAQGGGDARGARRRDQRRRDRRARRPRTRRSATARTRSSTSGAPTPSRAASPTRCARLAAANPDVMKLEQIGTSTLGKPILAIKMTAERAQRRRTARAPRCCSRPSTTRVSGSPPSRAAACRSGSPSTRTTRRSRSSSPRRELWFLPIQNSDGYDFTFTCGLGADQVPCDYRVRTADDNRFWRKTLRDNNTNGIYGDSQDGVDPNRNYPAKRAHRRRGRQQHASARQTYRGPYALSEPGNLAVDRLQRRVKFYGNINYHTDGQLLLTPVSLHDRLRAAGLDDLRGHDRHRRRQRRLPVPAAALVGPL